MTMEDAFRDMQDKGLASTSRQPACLPNLSKLTIQQAAFCVFLAKQTTVDYLKSLDYDAIDWREWNKIHSN